MIHHIIEAVGALSPKGIHIIVGHSKDIVIEAINQLPLQQQVADSLQFVEQKEQLGTGHAVMQALPSISPESTAVILNGDIPLIATNTLRRLIDHGDNLNLLTVTLDDPSGMGRIIRDSQHNIIGVVEHKDADADQILIKEINTNCMAGNAGQIKSWLENIDNQNAQGEYYLPDAIGNAVANNVTVSGMAADHDFEVLGVNSKRDLHQLERIYQRQQANSLLEQGVTLMDADRIDIRGSCEFGADCVLDVNVILEGNVNIGNNCSIGPNVLIRDSVIGDGSNIDANSVIDQSQIGENCNIGPFARVRPQTNLAKGVRIGNFVETKKSEIGEGSKVNHLAYVGDSTIGKNTNIGAGVITCNYDGVNKHQTIIGDNVFVGSDSQLVAPVEIGNNATVGAGSTITQDVDADALAITRVQQRSIARWSSRANKKSKK